MPYLGTTIRLRNTLTDYDGSPLTPDSLEVRIYDSEGTEVTGSPFTSPDVKLESEGVYYLDYTIPTDGKAGKWKAKWTAVKAEKPNIDTINFPVSSP